jgi:hypothetical protein
MFFVIDLRTKYRMGKALSTYKGAQRKADRLNLQYGAHRYVVVDINGREFF